MVYGNICGSKILCKVEFPWVGLDDRSGCAWCVLRYLGIEVDDALEMAEQTEA